MEDRRGEWQQSVDTRLVNLTSAQKSADADLDGLRLDHEELQREQTRVDHILRGNPENNLDGLIESIRALQKEVNKFNALLSSDSAGNPGYLKKIDMLLSAREQAEKREGYIWKFATAVAVQFLILTGLIIVNWDKIREYITLHEHIHQAAVVESHTKKLKAKRAHRKSAPVPVVEEPETVEPEATD